MAYSGLEVTPHNGLEIQAQPDENKYYTGSSEANEHVLSQPETHPGSKQTSRKKASWALAVITVLCLAVALGVGLEKGLATKKIVSTSSSPIITVTKSNVSSTTLAPATTSTTLLSASTTSSPECPAANGSTYIANNKPYSDLSSKHMIPETTLTYQILCNTNFQTNTTTVAQVLQIINNVTSLKDCLDACALYSFQTPSDNFPSLGCSGVTWNHNDVVPDCWLKRSMTLLLNDVESGIDAGVLIMPNT